jgi:hypothetical protein
LRPYLNFDLARDICEKFRKLMQDESDIQRGWSLIGQSDPGGRWIVENPDALIGLLSRRKERGHLVVEICSKRSFKGDWFGGGLDDT